MPKFYRCVIEVRGYELDSFGHVNHAKYISYLEQARWKMLEEEGISLNDFKAWNRCPVIAGIEARYVKPLFLGDMVEVHTSVADHGRTYFEFDQKMFRDGALVFAATVRAVVVNEKGRPAEVPEKMARLWG